ncbi:MULTISPECIES: hypothetical protein [unclassified Nonomuraea]|uniref:hypothetical protein n=1 Tax=unclassified Nonomuraea TaxID=2593643 RepID=UPI00340B9091
MRPPRAVGLAALFATFLALGTAIGLAVDHLLVGIGIVMPVYALVAGTMAAKARKAEQ